MKTKTEILAYLQGTLDGTDTYAREGALKVLYWVLDENENEEEIS